MGDLPLIDRRLQHTLRSLAGGAVLGLLLAAAGCSSGQLVYNVDHTGLRLGPTDLETDGIGFLTPAAGTGREADKQALAQSFANELERVRPGVAVRGLAEVLNSVNTANLDQQYKAMYRDYLQTGILDADVLAEVGQISEVRYLAQLSLAGFTQGNRSRLSLFGLRIFDTKQGSLRIFLQIWDAQSGTVVWEGSGELNYAYDTGRENPVTFAELCRLTAEQLFARLPGATDNRNGT
jgi:hypothetical protein